MTKKLPRINGLEFLGDYRLRLTFSDGFVGALDLRPILTGELFLPLREPALFRQAAVRHGTLVWPNDADLCPDVVRYWCETGRVCSQAELGAAFASPQPLSEMILNDKQIS
jgi:hypothetical protein